MTNEQIRYFGLPTTAFLRSLDGVWRCYRLVVALLLMMTVGVSGMWGFIVYAVVSL